MQNSAPGHELTPARLARARFPVRPAALPRQLERLDLGCVDRITPQGLECIAPLTRLTSLDLQGCGNASGGALTFSRSPGFAVHMVAFQALAYLLSRSS